MLKSVLCDERNFLLFKKQAPVVYLILAVVGR